MGIFRRRTAGSPPSAAETVASGDRAGARADAAAADTAAFGDGAAARADAALAPRVHGRVLEIQRMSTEDGPGLRTTLFVKGCSLRCAWCHNPESISPSPQPHWTASRCLGCGLCADACPRGAVTLAGGKIGIDRTRCDGCGACAAECPAAAMELWGYTADAVDIARELLRDKAYFGSDGGVTISGGEACLQPAFTRSVFDAVRLAACGTALDTCGMCSEAQFSEAAGGADLILFDLKDSDPARHASGTGGDLGRVLSNFRLALEMVAAARQGQSSERGQSSTGRASGPRAIWVRTPIIPGFTAFEDNIRGTARLLVREAAGLVERWELCAFNKLGAGKYEALGAPWALAEARMMGAEEMGALVGAAVSEGWPADKIAWTGMTRRES